MLLSCSNVDVKCIWWYVPLSHGTCTRITEQWQSNRSRFYLNFGTIPPQTGVVMRIVSKILLLLCCKVGGQSTIPSICDIRINLKALWRSAYRVHTAQRAHTAFIVTCYFVKWSGTFPKLYFMRLQRCATLSKWPTANDTLDALDLAFRNYIEMEFVLFCLN